MNKTELIATVAENTDITKREAERMVNATLDAIVEELLNGGKVSLSGFGVFEVKDVAERSCRNPKTGEYVIVPETRKPVFSVSELLKEKFNN